MVIPMNKHNTLDHQKVEISHNYLLGCLRYGEKHGKHILISCACMLLSTNMQFSCKHGGDGVSTLAMFNGHICPVIMQKYMYPLCYVL